MSALRSFVVDAGAAAWGRLEKAIDASLNGSWSVGAADAAVDAVRAARLVGATPWGDVRWPLVRGGVYRAVLEVAGLPVDLPDEAETARVDRMMQVHTDLTGDKAEARYAATVAAIRSPRESAYISSEGSA